MNSPSGGILITFLICSHQAPPTLDTAIQTIASQAEIECCEILLVNNGFDGRRAEELLGTWAGIPLRIVNEPRAGLGYARRRGFGAAKGRFLVLLDDDNTISPGFIAALRKTIEEDEKLGAVVARIEPVWEKPPAPRWLIDFGRKCLSYNTAGPFKPPYDERQYWPAGTVKMSIRPPGGGMIIHSDVARHYVANVSDETRISLARQPDSLVGCEDEDLFRGVPQLELGARYDAGLIVYHHIPASRMRMKYLLQLNRQMSYSYGMLYGYVKPQAIFSWGIEARRLLRNGVSLLGQCAGGRIHPARLLLEFSREIGWTQGRRQFELNRRHNIAATGATPARMEE